MTNISHPYRTQTPTPVCVTCGVPAHLRCPICERPFCVDHASIAPTCADCANRARHDGSVNVAALVGYTLGLGGVSSFLFTFNPIAGGVLGVLGALGGGIVAAIARCRGRSKKGWQVIEGNKLKVRADGGGDGQPKHHRSLSRRPSRSRAAFQNSIGRFQLG
jgi:hypothetical protein